MATAYLKAEFSDVTATLRFESDTETRNGERWATDIELIEVEVFGRKYARDEFVREFTEPVWNHFEVMRVDISDWE